MWTKAHSEICQIIASQEVTYPENNVKPCVTGCQVIFSHVISPDNILMNQYTLKLLQKLKYFSFFSSDNKKETGIVESHKAFCQSKLMFCNPLRQKHSISAPKNNQRSQNDNSLHCFASMWWIHVSVSVWYWVTTCHFCVYAPCVDFCKRNSNYSDTRPHNSAGDLHSAQFLWDLWRNCSLLEETAYNHTNITSN